METDGIQILVDEKIMTLKGTVVFVYGDNLGSNHIGGFTYDKCVKIALRTNSMIKGIKTHSCLNKLLNYHVCNPGLPPCLAHDFFEGFVPRDVLYAIKYFI